MKWIVGIAFILSSCYSFKGISIDPSMKYFSVAKVQDNSGSAPANYAIDFELALTNKIRRETRLIYNENKPDLKFECSISQYSSNSTAPIKGNTSAINRLSVTVNVIAINMIDENKKWEKSFTRFEDFDANKSLSEVQSSLIVNINKLLLEDIYNAAFSNW